MTQEEIEKQAEIYTKEKHCIECRNIQMCWEDAIEDCCLTCKRTNEDFIAGAKWGMENARREQIMKFDKSKVFTIFDCEEVKIGSKGFVSDYYLCLKDYVENGCDDNFGAVELDDNKFFKLKNKDETYQLFYLVEEPYEDCSNF